MAQEKYYDIRIPDTGDGFERLTQLICEIKYGCHFDRYGRNGQKQFGIDLFNKNFEICVQCKNYQTNNAVKMLLDGLEQDFLSAITKFHGSIHTYVLATTVQRDTAIQDAFASLSKKYPDIDINLLFWEDFQDTLRNNPDLIARAQYPSDADHKLQILINTLYDALCSFRRAINESDEPRLHSALYEINSVIQKFYDLGERHKLTQPVISGKCTKFVNQYNSFADTYTKYSIANRSNHLDGSLLAAVTMEFQALLTLSLEDKYTSEDILKQKLHDLLELLYNNLCSLRYALNTRDTYKTNTTLTDLADVVQKVFSISERYSKTYPDTCSICTIIVDQYNSFVTAYRAVLIERHQGNNSRIDELNAIANKHYKQLIDTILDWLK